MCLVSSEGRQNDSELPEQGPCVDLSLPLQIEGSKDPNERNPLESLLTKPSVGQKRSFLSPWMSGEIFLTPGPKTYSNKPMCESKANLSVASNSAFLIPTVLTFYTRMQVRYLANATKQKIDPKPRRQQSNLECPSIRFRLFINTALESVIFFLPLFLGRQVYLVGGGGEHSRGKGFK